MGFFNRLFSKKITKKEGKTKSQAYSSRKNTTVTMLMLLAFAFLIPAIQTQAADVRNSSTSADIFYNEMVDKSYDFSKIEKLSILEVDTSTIVKTFGMDISENYINILNELSKKYVDKMNCTLVDEFADAFIEIHITDWKSETIHIPEKTETHVHYEGYETVNDPVTYRPTPPPSYRDKRGKGNVRSVYRPLSQSKRRVWKVSSTWFPGSKKVVEKRVIPAHDVYTSEVKALFEIHDTQSGKVIISREGRVENNKGRLIAYEELCKKFFEDFWKIVR